MHTDSYPNVPNTSKVTLPVSLWEFSSIEMCPPIHCTCIRSDICSSHASSMHFFSGLHFAHNFLCLSRVYQMFLKVWPINRRASQGITIHCNTHYVKFKYCYTNGKQTFMGDRFQWGAHLDMTLEKLRTKSIRLDIYFVTVVHVC